MSSRVYEKHSLIRTSRAAMEAFHSDRLALQKLTPPPVFIQVHADRRKSLTDGELDFTLWFMILPVRWVALHSPIDAPGFADEQVRGPMAAWRHEHIFEETAEGVILKDRITFKHHRGLTGIATRIIFDGLALRFLFFYRHWRTRRSLES